MKNTLILQSKSIALCSLCMLGMIMMSCNSKRGQQLPTIGKSVALFDYFFLQGK